MMLFLCAHVSAAQLSVLCFGGGVQPLIPNPRACSPAASFGFSCPSQMVADALSGLFLPVREAGVSMDGRYTGP